MQDCLSKKYLLNRSALSHSALSMLSSGSAFRTSPVTLTALIRVTEKPIALPELSELSIWQDVFPTEALLYQSLRRSGVKGKE